ncbi:MAG: tagaturonate epimerase family protein, partial [Spirochaetota bacterium]
MDTENGLMGQRQRELLLAMIDHQGLLDASPEALARHRANGFGQTMAGAGVSYYPRSFFASSGLLFFMARMTGHGVQGIGSRRLFIISKEKLHEAFKGSSHSIGGRQVLEAELSYENYLAAAEFLPFLKPSSLRDKTTTIGCGDRLGASNPGHIRAARSFDISPVLAQQSIRELTLTGRTYPQVVRDAAFSVLQEGFDTPYGADGDHLKTMADIDVALAAGMPMITLDLTEVMNPAPAGWSDEAVRSAFSGLAQTVRDRVLHEYANKTFNLEDISLTIPESEAMRCALMYWKALDFTAEVDARLRSKRGDAYDLEVSIDETTAPTVPSHHLFIASELERRNVTVNSLAPRFIGEFQKGIDYIGDLAEFERQFIVHCKIAKAFGAGMGMGETCGAVTGALIVIGLKHAKPKGSSLFSKDKTEDIAREFT